MDQQYVGIDLHKRPSVVVLVDGQGNRSPAVRIDSDPAALLDAIAGAGEQPEVVLEATCGWYWAVDALVDNGARVHLANPMELNWGHRRVKNDERDAIDPVDMLRLGRLGEAWIAPPPVRQLRELVRYRAKLVNLRAGLKSQVPGVLTKQGLLANRYRLWGANGRRLLAEMPLDGSYRLRVDSLVDLIASFDTEVRALDKEIASWLAGDVGFDAIQAIRGVGPVLGAVFVAEIGDVTRFPDARHLCSRAGLTPRHRESDTKVRRGRISKMGSRMVRWAAIAGDLASERYLCRGDLSACGRATRDQRRPRRCCAQTASARVLRA